MNMRILPLALHLPPEQALTLVELLDQLRDLLVEAFGDDIAALQRAAIVCSTSTASAAADPPF
jgi:hypothetical protein